jgi:hypothetical protein
MHPDSIAPRAAGAGRNAYVNQCSLTVRDDLPESRSTAVAQDGAIATGEYRSHPPAFIAETPVTDGIDTAMNPVEGAGADPTANTGRGEAS